MNSSLLTSSTRCDDKLVLVSGVLPPFSVGPLLASCSYWRLVYFSACSSCRASCSCGGAFCGACRVRTSYCGGCRAFHGLVGSARVEMVQRRMRLAQGPSEGWVFLAVAETRPTACSINTWTRTAVRDLIACVRGTTEDNGDCNGENPP